MTYEEVSEAIRDMSKDEVMSVANQMDGHTIFDKSVMLEAGWPDELAEALCEDFESDTSSPKSTIFGNDGAVVDKLRGVYGLNLLSRIARALHVRYEPAMGRGFQAGRIMDALNKYYKDKERLEADNGKEG